MPRNDEHKGTSNRGFASMDQSKQRQIASKGGQSVPPEKRSFSQDPRLAAEAGRKGGESVPPEGRSFSQNRELAAEAGRKGGQSRGAAARAGRAQARKAAEAPEDTKMQHKDRSETEITGEEDREEAQAHGMDEPNAGSDFGQRPDQSGKPNSPMHGTR